MANKSPKLQPHTLDPGTFAYLKPTNQQLKDMEQLRQAAAVYAFTLDIILPPGPDKTFALRNHRTTAMWVNIAVTRHADGAPRE